MSRLTKWALTCVVACFGASLIVLGGLAMTALLAASAEQSVTRRYQDPPPVRPSAPGERLGVQQARD